jgi:hypothetical protein
MMPLVADPTSYWSLAVALQYLFFTCSDIVNIVQQVCLHMHARGSHISPL